MNINLDDINSDPSRANFHPGSNNVTMPTFFANELVNEVFDVIKEKAERERKREGEGKCCRCAEMQRCWHC